MKTETLELISAITLISISILSVALGVIFERLDTTLLTVIVVIVAGIIIAPIFIWGRCMAYGECEFAGEEEKEKEEKK